MTDKESLLDKNEYLKIGPVPPHENISVNYETSGNSNIELELSVLICGQNIQHNLYEHIRNLRGSTYLQLFDEIENDKISVDIARVCFTNMNAIERNVSLLWCAFFKRSDLLKMLIELGADPNYCDDNGYTPLHLSAFSGCLKATQLLLNTGVDPNVHANEFSPLHFASLGNSYEIVKLLINNGATIKSPNKHFEATLLQCAVKANSQKCLKLFVDDGADVNFLSKNGINAIHLAADLGHDKCLEVLLSAPNADANIYAMPRGKMSTALHMAAEEGSLSCVRLLLSKKADAKVQDYRGFTPLHKAARVSSVDCVEIILGVGGADVNAEDNDHRTPLHAAISKAEFALEVIEVLVNRKANVNARDRYGFTPLHLAAMDGLTECVSLLILLGANVTMKSHQGITALNVICRKTPGSIDMIFQKLDQSLSLSHVYNQSSCETELRLDFRYIIQHCHPRETHYLKTFVEEGRKEILQHPLCQAFIHVKWKKIRKYYFARMIFYICKVLTLTMFVLSVYATCCDWNSEELEKSREICQKESQFGQIIRSFPYHDQLQRGFTLISLTLIECYIKLYGMIGFTSVTSYFSDIQNFFEWFDILLTGGLIYYTRNTPESCQNSTSENGSLLHFIGAFTILLEWYNLMSICGQLPEFGAQIEMFNKIIREFFKLFIAFIFILIGFTLCFCIIFPGSKDFANPLTGLISVLVMMIGEPVVSVSNNFPGTWQLELSMQIMFIVFLFLITIVLMNLLVGIAVNDIKALRKTAELSKLMRQTRLIYHIESVIIIEWFPYIPRFLLVSFRKMLYSLTLISPLNYRVVLCIRPLNPAENRLPRRIMNAAFEVAKNKIPNHGNSYRRRRSDSDSSDDFNDKRRLEYLIRKVDDKLEKVDTILQEFQEFRTLLLNFTNRNI